MIFFVGAPLSVLNFWSAVEMRLKIPSDNYHIYMERNVTMVQKQHEDSQSAWFYQVLPWKTQTIKINIFEQTCVGILTRDSYKISLMVKNVDYSFCKYYFIQGPRRLGVRGVQKPPTFCEQRRGNKENFVRSYGSFGKI